MRIAICSKRDIVANVALHRLLPKLCGLKVGILLANRRREQVFSVPQLHLLRLLEEDLPNRVLFPLSRGAPSASLSSFEALADREGAEIVDASGGERGDRSRILRGFEPDLVLCLKFGFILAPEDLNIPRLGTYNLHTGRLPDRPGLHAVFWAMHDGDPTATATVHKVDSGVDTGPVVSRADVPIAAGRSFFATMLDVYLLGADLLAEVALRAARGEPPVPRIQEPSKDRRYVGLPTAEDIANLERNGHPFISPDDYLDLACGLVSRRSS